MRLNCLKGFSLIEILVVTAIVAIIIFLFGSLFFGGWVNYEATLARVSLQEKTDNFFMVLEEDVMESNDFAINAAGKQLVLTYPAAAGFDFTTVTYDFTTDGAVMRTTTGVAGTQTLISRGIGSGSVFLEDAVSGVLACQLVLSENIFGQTITMSGIKRLMLRN